MESFVWKSPCERDFAGDAGTASFSTLISALFETVAQHLDFHDLCLLLCTGSAHLRSLVYQKSRMAHMGSFDGRYEALDKLTLPPRIFSLIPAFNRLESLQLVAPNWPIPSFKASPFRNLPRTLRHLAVEALFHPKLNASIYLDVHWVTAFPALESLHLCLLIDQSEDALRGVKKSPVGFHAHSLPPSLTSLSLHYSEFSNSGDLLNFFLLPIGYDLNRQPTKREKFLSLELPLSLLPGESFVTPAVGELDLTLAPPALHTLILQHKRPLQDPSPYFERASAMASDPSFKLQSSPSSMLHLEVRGELAKHTLLTLPPSLTWIHTNGFWGTKVETLLPNLRYFSGSSLDVNGLVHRGSLPSVVHMQSHGAETATREGLRSLALVHRHLGVALSLSPFPASLTSLHAIGNLASCEEVGALLSPLVGLKSLRLSVMKALNFNILPRGLDELFLIFPVSQLWHHIALDGLPPGLTSLTLSIVATRGFIMASDLQHLPAALKHCRLPAILVPSPTELASTSIASSSSSSTAPASPSFFRKIANLLSSPRKEALPNDQAILSLMALLPRSCIFHTRLVFKKSTEDQDYELIPRKAVHMALGGTLIRTVI